MRSSFPQNLDTDRLSAAEYFDLRGLTDVFERVGAIAGCNLTLYRDNYPELVGGACASADMIPMTASAPILGRIFMPEDDKPGAPLMLVLTYELWQRRFHGSKFFSKSIASEMLTVQKAPFGLGVELQGTGPSLEFSHAASNSGFRAFLVMFRRSGRVP